MRNPWLTLPNILSEFRIVAAPFLLLLAWHGQHEWFLFLLALAFTSDALDGYFARRLQETSQLGAELDSWGDLTTFLLVPVSAWWLWPQIIHKEAIFIGIVLTAYLFPMAISFGKFGVLPSYHTWIAKTSTVLMTISIFLLFIFDFPWAFRVLAITQILVASEEVAITLLLPVPRKNVRSYWHVRRLCERLSHNKQPS